MANKSRHNKLDNPVSVIDEITDELGDIRSKLVDEAAQIGYARNRILSTRPVWEALSNYAPNNSQAYPIYASGVSVLNAILEETQRLKEQELASTSAFQWVADAASSIVSVVSSTGSLIGDVVNLAATLSQPPFDLERFQQYADRFTRFDAALGKTYREIGEVLYATQADPERAALYLMRQAFDHLFDRLSPNKEVSRWLCQSGIKPKQITREQRIKYAADRHISDRIRAKTLSVSATHTVEIYDALQHAHKRGELNQERARKALEEMQTMLEQWADALEI